MNYKPDPLYAFPQIVQTIPTDRGMTLRDYFAAKAMQSIMNDPATTCASSPNENDDIAKEIAKFSYVMADAMLAARDSTP